MNIHSELILEGIERLKRKRLDFFNNEFIGNGEKEIYSALYRDDIPRIDIGVRNTVRGTSYEMFIRSFQNVSEEMVEWEERMLTTLVRESEFMESIGYEQYGFSNFTRKVDEDRLIHVFRTTRRSTGVVFIELVENTHRKWPDFERKIRMEQTYVCFMREAVLSFEREAGSFWTGMFTSMNSRLRDLVIGGSEK